jgi:hypothetical protein
MKCLIFACSFLLIIGCSSKNEICACIEKGQEVNALSASFFDRPYAVLGKDSLDALIRERDLICEPFKTMSGEEMLEKKKTCGIADFSGE